MEENIEQNLPLLPIIVGFIILVVSTLLLERKLRKRAQIREGQLPTDGKRVYTVEERVSRNSAWASGKIRAVGIGPVIALWLLAITWNLTFGVSFLKGLENPAFATGPRVVLGIFAALGVVPLYFALQFTRRRYRYGDSWCFITGKAGVLGNTFQGTIRTEKEITPTGDYSISLQCLESYQTGSGKHRTTKTNVHWQGKQSVPHRSQSSRAGIPFSFQLPTEAPETGYFGRNKVNWQLRIDAPAEGVSYVAIFIVPVFEV